MIDVLRANARAACVAGNSRDMAIQAVAQRPMASDVTGASLLEGGPSAKRRSTVYTVGRSVGGNDPVEVQR